MKEKLLEILNEYSKHKAGYIPLNDREELVDKILKVLNPEVDWTSLDNTKWDGVTAYFKKD